MFLEIPDLLTPAEIAQLREFGATLNFVDGRATNPDSKVKNNLHADQQDPRQRASSELLGRALGRSAPLVAYAFPKRMAPPVLTKYRPGMNYGAHADNAFLPIGAQAAALRPQLHGLPGTRSPTMTAASCRCGSAAARWLSSCRPAGR